MPINRDLSALPTAPPSEGKPPDSKALAVLLPIVDEWHRQYLARGEDTLEFAVEGTRFRASWAAKCARALSYSVLHNDAEIALADLRSIQATNMVDDPEVDVEIGVMEAEVARWQDTNPNDVASFWIFKIGHLVHEEIQKAAAIVYPDAEIEVKVDLNPDANGSGTMDLIIRIPKKEALGMGLAVRPKHSHYVIAVELKSINGYGFKVMATPFNGPAGGPRRSAVIQGSLTATAIDADLLVVGYFSLENVSPDMAAKYVDIGPAGRFMAGWSYSPEEFRGFAEREHKRINAIHKAVDANKLAPRAVEDWDIPSGARVTDPKKGLWVIEKDGAIVQTGKTWQCGYCNQLDRCLADGPGTPVIIRT